MELTIVTSKVLILNAKDVSNVNRNVATSYEAHGVKTRCTVERLHDWRTPVDDERLSMFIRNRETTNVKDLRVFIVTSTDVDTAKAQCLVTNF